MALNGLQIQKLLPKTNCKECGSNTCLAFAMKLAAKKANLSECPYASEEAKQVLGAASEPPVKGLTIGSAVTARLGEETVLYRHEKTFVNQTVIGVNVCDDDPALEETLARIRDYRLERVGETLSLGAVGVTQRSDNDVPFVHAARRAWEVTQLPVVLRAQSVPALMSAADLVGAGSILAGVTTRTAQTLRQAAEDQSHLLAITAPDMDGLYTLAQSLRDDGFDRYLLEFPVWTPAQALQINAMARRAALKDGNKALGHPSLRFIDGDGGPADCVAAVGEITKYGGVCILPRFDPALLVTLLALRQNIYTDPQKPIQMEPKVYSVGEPDRQSPVFVTTNFSLTYFLVSAEIENSGLSAWLLLPECEGFSVLTAWAAGKFSGAHIGKFVRESGLEQQTDCRTLIIPGYVAQISGELEEALPNWKILVGPQEASDLEAFIKNNL